MSTATNTAPQSKPEAWYLGPYFILATLLLITALAYPLASTVLGSKVLEIITTALLVSSLYAVIEKRWLFRALAIVVLPILVANWVFDESSHQLYNSTTNVITELFFIVVLIAIFSHVIRAKRITADLVFGSIAIYLLFGVIMAFMFFLVNDISPGTVIAGIGDASDTMERRDQFSDFLYFSFITLTSVGYGDLTPLGPAARSMAMFEGIVGQLYVAILIARIVGIHIAQE